MNDEKRSRLMQEMLSLQEECGKESLHDELYGTKHVEKEKEPASGFQMIALADLMPYHSGAGHPFAVTEDEDMKRLREILSADGKVLEPILVRPEKEFAGKYEIIAGHRRTKLSREFGWETIPAIICADMDEADITKLMIVTNTEGRKNLKPSTLARAYKQYLEANKKARGGDRKSQNFNENQFVQVEQIDSTISAASKNFGVSISKIQRYARLTELYQPLLAMIDEDKLKMGIGVELSYLPMEIQELVHRVITKKKVKVSLEDAQELRRMQKEDSLTPESVVKYFREAQEEKTRAVKPLKLNEKYLTALLPKTIQEAESEKKARYLEAALANYEQYLQLHPEENENWK